MGRLPTQVVSLERALPITNAGLHDRIIGVTCRKWLLVDILLVVNMFLTGFDCRTLNTMYVDKNLRYHGLIQAYSRTNRILNEVKSQGNIVVFRNLKKRTERR
jgi:hypothetical protein